VYSYVSDCINCTLITDIKNPLATNGPFYLVNMIKEDKKVKMKAEAYLIIK